jgi:class 3 adenylate cyclase
MEPRIQYARTKDGVSIAYSIMGEGMPLVYMPTSVFSSVQLAQTPESNIWIERLSRTRMLVRYDGRGSGLSDRDVSDFSLEGQLLDLDAVVGSLGLGRFALLGNLMSGPAAITYAARQPEMVGNLILWCTWMRGADFFSLPQIEGLLGLLEKDWALFVQTATHLGLGWSEGSPGPRRAAAAQEATTPQAARASFLAMKDCDLSELLPQVRSRTLVLHRRESPMISVDLARSLASRVPNARLVLLEGSSAAIYVGEVEPVLQAIDEFLGEGEEKQRDALASRDVHTILFTDVEESTALTDRLGDAKARDVLRTHERIVREALRSHGGSEVKTMGDGFMASFSSATKALECAIAIQRSFEEHNEAAEEPIRVRVGLNAGEPIAEEEDLFGTAVIRAARIAALAAGGEILVANVVRELSEGKGFLFADRGDTALRGFEDPVRLFEVRWRAEGSPHETGGGGG